MSSHKKQQAYNKNEVLNQFRSPEEKHHRHQSLKEKHQVHLNNRRHIPDTHNAKTPAAIIQAHIMAAA
jgi:hypothetical protein